MVVRVSLGKVVVRLVREDRIKVKVKDRISKVKEILVKGMTRTDKEIPMAETTKMEATRTEKMAKGMVRARMEMTRMVKTVKEIPATVKEKTERIPMIPATEMVRAKTEKTRMVTNGTPICTMTMAIYEVQRERTATM